MPLPQFEVKIIDPPKRFQWSIRNLFLITAAIATAAALGQHFGAYQGAIWAAVLWLALLYYKGVMLRLKSLLVHISVMSIILTAYFWPCLTAMATRCWLAPWILLDALLAGTVLSSAILFVPQLRKWLINNRDKQRF